MSHICYQWIEITMLYSYKAGMKRSTLIMYALRGEIYSVVCMPCFDMPQQHDTSLSEQPSRLLNQKLNKNS